MSGSSSTVQPPWMEVSVFTPETVGATLNALDLSLVCPLSNRLLCVHAGTTSARLLSSDSQVIAHAYAKPIKKKFSRTSVAALSER